MSDWRDLLDAGLDAMKVGRHEEAERTFDELDDLHAGWQFEVPYRNRRTLQHTLTRRRARGGKTHQYRHTRMRDHRARDMIAAMLHLAHEEANHHRGRAFGYRALAGVFGVRGETMRSWVRRGLDDLGIVDEHGDPIPIESDFSPEERKQALIRRLKADGRKAEGEASYADWKRQLAAWDLPIDGTGG